MSLWQDYQLAQVVILTRSSPNMLVFVTLPHQDFSCYVISARHLPDMLYPCDQIFASHVIVARQSLHRLCHFNQIDGSRFCHCGHLSLQLFHCSQAAVKYSIAATFIFSNKYFVLDNIICSSNRDFVKYLKRSVPAIFY